MNSGMSWQDLLELVANATGETIYMVVIATFFTILIGLPLGVLLFVSRPNGVLPAPRVNTLVGAIVNLGRSMPFVVLLIALIPITRWIIGTTLGSTAAIVPITLGAIPFLPESSKQRWMKLIRGELRPFYQWADPRGMWSKKCYYRKPYRLC